MRLWLELTVGGTFPEYPKGGIYCRSILVEKSFRSAPASWNLFNGFADKARIEERQAALRCNTAEQVRADSAIRWQVRRAGRTCALLSDGSRLRESQTNWCPMPTVLRKLKVPELRA
jgi:hypothetical protein